MTNHHKKFNFGNFIKDVGKGVAEVEKPVASVFNTGINAVKSVDNNLISSSKSVFSNLSIPLIIGGCVIGYLIISKKI